MKFKNENRRYLINFSTQNLESSETDFLVVGSGIAGLRAAISLSAHGRVKILTKDRTQECNSYLAQGGIAAAIGENDNIRYHVEDTVKTGAGLCCQAAVSILVNEGPRQIADFLEFGANFDMTQDNRIALTREGAHTKDRIVHAHGDAIGLELELTLIKKAKSLSNIYFAEGVYLVDILSQDERAYGAIVYEPAAGKCSVIYSKALILATGGIGYLFQSTTNSHIATGDGVAIARRAGAAITDMEFIQFHPTTLFLDNAPRFLISEAVRGEGAYLVNVNGERFMRSVHEMAELAPRDIVSREILKQIENTSHPCVYLDISHLPAEFLIKRFPKIYSNCLRYGVDITNSPIPVKPSAHYMIGGIKSGLEGETNIAGLYVCGESACTFVHGANRLASNSLLECVVFGSRAAEAAAGYCAGSALKKINISYDYRFYKEPKGFSIKLHGERVINDIRRGSWENLGIVRNAAGFDLMERLIEKYEFIKRLELNTLRSFSIANMIEVADVINKFCRERRESRGTHFRSDYDAVDDINFKFHLVETKGRLSRLEA